ncbi:MAG: enolase C-terminal domain-like protein [Rikenellaceae bacterium]
MKRFFLLITLFVIGSSSLFAAQLQLSQEERNILESERIDSIRTIAVKMDFVRHVGRNAKKAIPHDGPTINICVVNSPNYQGLGEIRGSIKGNKLTDLKAITVGKTVLDLLDPTTLLVKEEYRELDIPIYDLIGIILNKPVYMLFGTPNKERVRCYSGMIYMEDLEFEKKKDGNKKIVEICKFDYDYGYRDLKIKLGRGGLWMEREEGLKRDIEIVKLIHKKFPDVRLLVDPNDAYTVEETIYFMEKIKPIEFYWFEEPFEENEADYKIFREWQRKNAPTMLLADGETDGNKAQLLKLGEADLIDVVLQDIIGFGFTNWIEYIEELKARGMTGSPHNWGTLTKNFYSAYLAMAIGGIDIVEGVTSSSKMLDFGDYSIKDGYFIPSNRAGFGIILK